MVIILTELLHTEQTIHLSGLLLTVYKSDLVVSDGKLLVRVNGPLICIHCIGTAHGLCSHGIIIVLIVYGAQRHFRNRTVILRDACLGINISENSGNDEHIVYIVSPVTADEPELLVIDYGSLYLLISVPVMDLSPEFHESPVKPPSSWKPVRHSGCGFTEHEQVKLGSELFVISLHSFFDHIKMSLEFILTGKCIDIDPLHYIPLLISSPICR